MSRQSCIQSLSESLFIVSDPQRKKCILLRPLHNKQAFYPFILLRQFNLSGNRKVRVSDDFNIEFRLFRQDIVSDDTGDQVGDKIVDTAMSRVLYPAEIFEHIIDRFDQGSLSQ